MTVKKNKADCEPLDSPAGSTKAEAKCQDLVFWSRFGVLFGCGKYCIAEIWYFAKIWCIGWMW